MNQKSYALSAVPAWVVTVRGVKSVTYSGIRRQGAKGKRRARSWDSWDWAYADHNAVKGLTMAILESPRTRLNIKQGNDNCDFLDVRVPVGRNLADPMMPHWRQD